jgi:hypothetical protein
VVGNGPEPKEIPLNGKAKGEYVIDRSQWYGFYAKDISNSMVYFNRGEPLRLIVAGNTVRVRAEVAGRKVKARDRYDHEIFTLGYPVDVDVNDVAHFVRVNNYLANPT